MRATEAPIQVWPEAAFALAPERLRHLHYDRTRIEQHFRLNTGAVQQNLPYYESMV
jgi:hypothetical protein